MLELQLFYGILVLQIFLFSFYFPKLLLQRMQSILTNYPPQEYPLLYTSSVDECKIFHRRYALFNHLCMAFGIALVAGIVLNPEIMEASGAIMLPWGYFMLQMLPLLWLEVSQCSQLKQIRKGDFRTLKQASLTPRRLFNFISPLWIAIAVIAYFSLAVIGLHKHDYDINFSSDAMEKILILGATNIGFIVVVYFALYGKKKDPYMADKDRMKQIGVIVKTAVFTSIAMSLFAFATEVFDSQTQTTLLTIVMSIYCQAIAFTYLYLVLKTMKPEDVDFSVYQANE